MIGKGYKKILTIIWVIMLVQLLIQYTDFIIWVKVSPKFLLQKGRYL